MLRLRSSDGQPQQRHCQPTQPGGVHRHHGVNRIGDRNAGSTTVVPTRAAHHTIYPPTNRAAVEPLGGHASLCLGASAALRPKNAGHLVACLCTTSSLAAASEATVMGRREMKGG